MQQRVALARALAIEPRVLLLDEPLSALDAKVRVQLREEIRRIQLELGITTIYVTHDQEEALAISDRVAVLHDGRIDQIGTPVEMYGAPGDAVRRRVHRDDEPARVHGRRRRASSSTRASGSRVDAARGLPNGERVLVLVRPETVEHRSGGRRAEPGRRRSPARSSRRSSSARSRALRMAGSSGEGELTADLPTTQAQAHAIGDRVSGTFPSATRAAAQPGRAARARRSRSGRSLKIPSAPRSTSSRIRSGSFTV